jgi:CRP/FNR family cyclic AMP-dependent transcriptional regulator
VITAEHLARIAVWARELSADEVERARRGVVERSVAQGAYVFHRGDRFDHWTGVVDGLVKIGTVSSAGKNITFAGIRSGGWFGEGTLLKSETRRYDLVALRDSRLALMNRDTFHWLFDHSVGFNRFLVHQLNERLGQFIALVEYDRMLAPPARVARCIAWLFDPVLYPGAGQHLAITQEEIGLLSGISRQAANKALAVLAAADVVRLDHSGLTVLDLTRLRRFGE